MVLQECGFPRQARVAELVDLWRSYYPAPRPLGDLLEVVELTKVRDTQVRKLSGGQRRRLDFALALAGDPDLIFLTTPSALRGGRVPLPDGIDLTISGPEAVCQTASAAMILRMLLDWAQEHDLGDLDGLAVTAPRLEDTYLQLTSGDHG